MLMFMCTMKTNTTPKKPLHLHVEHLMRHRIFVATILVFLTIAIFKTESKLLGTMKEAYAQGVGAVGSYMREETVRMPVTINMAGRIPTISGQ